MPQVAVSDGFRMSYQARGSGRPLLLVHGWAAHGGFFAPQMDGLADRFRVICPDLRGHGRSPAAPDEEITLPRLGRDLADFIAALDLADVVAVGWSMGAMVLWEACLQGAADRIAGLVVEDMSPRIVNDEDWSLGLKGGYDATSAATASQRMTDDWPAFSRLLSRSSIGAPDEKPDLAAWLEGEFAAQAPEPLAGLWSCLADQDYRAKLASIDMPALIVHGGLGLYDAEAARYLERELPSATRVRFENSGHSPHLEEPYAFNQLITEFAARTSAGSSPAGAAATA